VPTLACPRCGRALEFSGDRPRFCAYCGSPLSSMADATVDHAPGQATEAYDSRSRTSIVADEGAPVEVAGYRIVREIGRGGMGTVYEAEDARFGRRVALKRIAAGANASTEAVERFRQEGRLASTIAHPRCVFVLAADEEAGVPYIVMELMPGTTLQNLVKEGGPLGIEDAAAKILDIIDGLREAHRVGVVHRDVKPSNCFLDVEGRVKVGDFGLSKSLTTDNAHLTRTGAFVGTPLYASPEQIKGDPIDPRTDVYSVCATLYYLLAGRPPFQESDAAATLARIVSESPPPLRSLRPEVPTALEFAIARGMERDRDRRWRGLDELRGAIEPFAPRPVTAARPWPRFLAGLIDHFVLVRPIEVVFNLVAAPFWVPIAVYATASLAYFGIVEGVTGQTIGKALLGLKTRLQDRREPPGPTRGLVRGAVYFAIVDLPFELAAEPITRAFGGREDSRGDLAFMALRVALTAVGLAALFATARAATGFRGLHELASETRTILAPRRERRRGPVAGRRRPVGSDRFAVRRPTGVMQAVGPYKVRGAIAWEGDRRVLSAEDSALGREVWVVVRPRRSPEPPASRRELTRDTRPRWLGGGEQAEGRWDAFVAPGGCALADLAGVDGLPWAEARPILLDLAVELAAACRDGTLPEGLSIDQIWLEPDGRVLLVDPLGAAPAGASTPERRALDLLHEAAALALEGGGWRANRRSATIRAAVPLHARDVLDRLGPGPSTFDGPAAVAQALADDADRPVALSVAQRVARAAGVIFVTPIRLLAALALGLVPKFVGAAVPGEGLLDFVGPRNEIESAGLAALPVGLVMLVAWAFTTRGGLLATRLLGTGLVRRSGRPPARWACAWREVVLLVPYSAMLAAIAGPLHRVGLSGAYAFEPAALAWLGVVALFDLFDPGRMLHDLAAGTRVVPR